MTTQSTNSEPSRGAASFQMPTALRAVVVLALIYIFLLGVTCLEQGIGAMSGDVHEQLFSRVSNPVAALFVGMLATVLVQSSSATTSIIVGLVASGALGIDSAVYMVMGANIGTTVTNTLVSLGHVRRGEEFRRAFAAATVHDFFNVFTVCIMFTLEYTTGLLSDAAAWLSGLFVGTGGAEFDSPITTAVEVPVEALADVLDQWFSGTALGVALLGIGLLAILLSLTLITKNMRTLVAARVERSLNVMLGRGGGVMAIMLGLVITMAVQSSSITTSILIPLSAAGVLSLRNAYPVTLGANVGTTITALLAALAASSRDALTIAFAHTLFNVGGILFIYTLPFTRYLPVHAAERLAALASHRPRWAIAYVFGTFIVVPLVGIFVLG